MSREDPTLGERAEGGIKGAALGAGLAAGIEVTGNLIHNTFKKAQPPREIWRAGTLRTVGIAALIVGAFNFIFRKGVNERNDMKKAGREAAREAMTDVREQYRQEAAPAQDSTKFRDMVTSSRAQSQDVSRG